MWNLEHTERIVVRLLFVAMVMTAMMLVLMSLQVQPQRLSPVFAPTTPTILSLPNK